jgi:hypothetical protein
VKVWRVVTGIQHLYYFFITHPGKACIELTH